MLMIFGDVVFEAVGLPIDSAERSRDYRWAENQRVRNTPAYQYTGRGTETLSFSAVLHPEYTEGALSLEPLAQMAEDGEAYLLMSGYGKVYGYYALEKIGDNSSYFTSDGIPQKIEVSLSLKKIDDDAPIMEA